MLIKTYKYYAGITSQLAFCATPLRLDISNSCQYGCEYCFANTRQGHGRKTELQVANPKSLENRLKRVFSGKISSALDECISQRIPFQLGGMSDPFTKLEIKYKTSLEYLKILKKYDYPNILSTKSDLISEKEYLEVLKKSNTYVRFSTTVIDDKNRKIIDKNCPELHKIKESAKKIADMGVPVSFRLQPIIPGFEYFAKELIELAAEVGAKHISAEYLKVSLDSNKNFGNNLQLILEKNPIEFYMQKNAKKQGREYNLPLEYRQKKLIDMSIMAKKNGMTFGFADNDLLIHSDGAACCNASDLYLRNAKFFQANIVSVAKNKKINEKIKFHDYLSCWIPRYPVSTYLNSKARIKTSNTQEQEWIAYLKKMWNGDYGVYSPDFFDGIEKTSDIDNCGLPVYVRKKSIFEKLYDIEKKLLKNI